MMQGSNPIGGGFGAGNVGANEKYSRIIKMFEGQGESATVSSNSIKTSKYTILTFLPRNLSEQFRRAANVYFLVIAVLTCLPTSGKNAPSFIATFIFVLLITAVKEAWEDYGRFVSDKVENGRKTKVYRNDVLQDLYWPEIKVGDVVRVEKGELFPSDLLFIASPDTVSAIAYVDTCNLDGETTLKTCRACTTTKSSAQYNEDSKSSNALRNLNITVELEDPKADLYSVNGVLYSKPASGDKEIEPLKIENILLRGCTLRNTSYIIGLVLYTGKQTKIMLNASKPPSKQSQIMIMMNKCLYMVFLLMGILCLGNSIAAYFWQQNIGANLDYLDITAGGKSQLGLPLNSGTFIFEAFLTFIVGYSHLVPISLYFGLEMIKVIQKFLVDNDLSMYNEETDIGAYSRTSNLIEDLGQVQFVFSDKTGTLTCNQMEFISASIGNVIYGEYKQTAESKNIDGGGMSTPLDSYGGVVQRHKIRASSISGPDSNANSKRRLSNARLATIKNENLRTGFDFRGDAYHILKGYSVDSVVAENMKYFWLCLAICHGVEIDTDIKSQAMSMQLRKASLLPTGITPDEIMTGIVYQAASPDELALVNAARAIGFIFYQRNAGSVVLSLHGKRTSFETLHTIGFTSTRKRMTMVVRNQDGELIVFCKGADDMIIERRNLHSVGLNVETLMNHINAFSAQGLRTLCLSMKKIDAKFWSGWKMRYNMASGQVTNRQALIEALENELESDLELLGATAIEDNLQQGVPDTIQTLRNAGIKVWVLTGDKQGTAIDIGFSCNLLNKEMRMCILSDAKDSDSLIQMIQQSKDEITKSDGNRKSAIVINGAALALALLPEVRNHFLALAMICEVCICCRVSPKQKADVVKLVRYNLPVVTLAIGDGANDVAMIQEAHIGIGISGMEGTQAARSSDYSIAQFKFLKPLLFIHGRIGYLRISTFLSYYFYKNVALCMTEFWFAWYNGFSGQLYFPSMYSLCYNAFYTSFPSFIALGMDRDVSLFRSLTEPRLYYRGQLNEGFNRMTFGIYIARAIFQGAICFFIPFNVLTAANANGQETGNWYIGTAAFTTVVLLVTFQLFLEVTTWNSGGLLACLLSIFMFLFASLIFAVPAIAHISFFDYYSESIFYLLLADGKFWLTIIVTLSAALLPGFFVKYIYLQFRPKPCEIISELDAGFKPKKPTTISPE